MPTIAYGAVSMSMAGVVTEGTDLVAVARPPTHRAAFDRAIELYRLSLVTQRHAVEVLTVCAARRRRAQPSVVITPSADEPRPVLTRRQDAGRVPATSSGGTHPAALTRRQREVARLIARGYTNAQIAEALVVTEGTAANHVAAILQRLELTNRTQVAAWAVSADELG